MQDLAQIELSDLYDMLAQHTNRYMTMLSGGASKEEFDLCRETIISIQAEIQSRKNQESQNKPSTSTNFPSRSFLNRPKN